jgi:hypothetical protein
MESKKINQLATELTPSLSDLTIIGDPSTGISKKITLSQMASLFTGTVEEYASLAAFPLVGVADTIYIALDTNVLYRWDTGLTSYVELSPNIINSLVFNDANGFDGTISLVGSVATLTITTALTTGSVGFIGASGALLQDNANFFWDDTNNRLGLGTNAPTTAIDVFGSGIIGRLNGTSTNNAFLGFSSAGTNKWSIGNVQADHRFRIYNDATTSELVSVLQTGEFGIGIANPTTKLHIDGGASALIANLDANVSVAKSISFRSDNSNRINLEVSGTESGSNAGANFFLRTYTDLGALIETPFQIIRSTGVTTIKSLTLTNALSVANGGTGSTTQNFVDLTTTQSIGGAKTFTSLLSGTTISLSTNYVGGSVGMLHLTSNGTEGGAITLEKTSGTAQKYKIGCNSTNQFVIFNETAVNQPFTITSAGAASFINTLTINGASVLTTLNVIGAGANGILLDQDSTSGNASSRLFFKMSSQTYAMLADASGLNFMTGATAGSTSGSAKMTITSAGVLDLPIGQIKFPATQNPSSDANTLDDYEEGTWTPTLLDSSNSSVYSSGTKYGTYTKVGRIVTATAVFDATTCVAGNSVKVSNLPFTITSDLSRYPAFNSHTTGTALTGTTIHGGYARPSETNFQLIQRDSSSTVNFSAGSFSMFLTIIYVI